jgi:hypothetical protein
LEEQVPNRSCRNGKVNDAPRNEINTEREPYRIPRDTSFRFIIMDESSTEVSVLDDVVLTVTPHIFRVKRGLL